MSKPVLLIRLEGVWQSWGERSRWDLRDTGNAPTKSGIIGLLGCALGYPMYDSRLEEELGAGIRLGVRVESPGRIVQDFQTVTDFLPTANGSYKYNGSNTDKSLRRLTGNPNIKPSAIVSPRYYLEDASFLVALEEREGFDGLIDKFRAALQRPKWPIFLGRKACIPTRPVYDPQDQYACNGMPYASIEDALNHHPWSWLGGNTINRQIKSSLKLTVLIETSDGEMQRQDAVRTNQARQYGYSSVHRSTICLPERNR
ncbi:MAG: type I-E CRISPR-associated protein Cas5/CasD [Armatimonadota bacterium]